MLKKIKNIYIKLEKKEIQKKNFFLKYIKIGKERNIKNKKKNSKYIKLEKKEI